MGDPWSQVFVPPPPWLWPANLVLIGVHTAIGFGHPHTMACVGLFFVHTHDLALSTNDENSRM